MTERERQEYMEQIANRGIVPGLERVRELCKRLGDPQEELAFVHVAGTNGKGSVCTYVAQALMEAGLKVGRYISPVIFDYREKIQINNRCISIKALQYGMDMIRQHCDSMVAEGWEQPTPFEVETALAFWYYREKKCDIVVLETGMGGLEDATNIIHTTEVAVIASVSMDHMKFLGNTLSLIASQKAGIIKPGCAVVSAPQQPEAETVLRNTALTCSVPITFVDREKIKDIRYGLKKQSFSYGEMRRIEIPLAGVCQPENCVLALEVIRQLNLRGFHISEEQFREGCKKVQWPGRFQVLSDHPCFVVDGAHNEDASRRLAQSIQFYFTNRRIIYIMGVLKDKEYDKIIENTHFLADQILTVTPPEPNRALPAYELAKAVAAVHPNVTAVDSVEEAVELSHLLAGRDDVIVAFGTLSFVGKIISAMEQRKQKGRDKNGRSR